MVRMIRLNNPKQAHLEAIHLIHDNAGLTIPVFKASIDGGVDKSSQKLHSPGNEYLSWIVQRVGGWINQASPCKHIQVSSMHVRISILNLLPCLFSLAPLFCTVLNL